MAELVNKIRDGANYKDGDILAAFNNRMISCAHSQHLYDVTQVGFQSNGLRPTGLARDALDIVYQYRFERVSQEVNRIETDHLGNVLEELLFSPDKIDVAEFVRRRRKHAKHRIFGTDGAEVWHGGRTDFTQAAIDAVWDKIEYHTPKVRTHRDFELWPMGTQDVRSHLAIRVVDFTDAEAATSVAPRLELDDNGDPVLDEYGQQIVLAKRNLNIDWRREVLPLLPGVTKADVLDRGKSVDKRREHIPQRDRAKIHSKTRGGPLLPQ